MRNHKLKRESNSDLSYQAYKQQAIHTHFDRIFINNHSDGNVKHSNRKEGEKVKKVKLTGTKIVRLLSKWAL